MKNLLLLFMTLGLLVSCHSSDDETAMNAGIEEEVSEEPVAGEFVSDAHPTMGTVTVNKDQTKLTITNFKNDGPRLLMYLSTSVDSQDYADLGDLKGA